MREHKVVVSEGNTTMTLKLASLPIASPLPHLSGVQVVSDSGSPVIYRQITLSGYHNLEPLRFCLTLLGISTVRP